jgi:hypothetical protein
MRSSRARATEPSGREHGLTEEPRPPLSVVIATRSIWPEIEPTLDALVPQARASGVEILVVDGNGRALERDAPEGVRVLGVDDCDIYRLRAVGLVEARGDIVAFTEDHCVPAPDFCALILRAHQEHARPAVAGAVVNGSRRAAIDRANFHNVHGDTLPTLLGTAPSWGPTPSNISFKRPVIPDAEPPPGWLEVVFGQQLRGAEQITIDPSIVVSHVQSTGPLGTFTNHYRAGRSYAGHAAELGDSRPHLAESLRNARSVVRSIVGRARRAAKETGDRRLLPLNVGLALAGALGVVVGGLRGPGRSGERLR